LKVIVVGGFLGSGKTTTLIRLGTHYSSLGKKVGIIVNEIGEIGIDGDVISQYGLETKEITSGCICCSLKTSLRATVLLMVDNFHPDIIIIESTGVAYPGVIRDEIMLMNLPIEYEIAPLLTLFDGSRFKQILKEIKNFAAQQLAQAEVIAISKSDLTEPSFLPIIEEAVRQMNPTAKIISLSSKNAESFSNLVDILEASADSGDFSDSSLKDKTENRSETLKKKISEDGRFLMAHSAPDNSIEASGVGTFSVEYSLDEASLKSFNDFDFEQIVRGILSQIRADVLMRSPNFLGHIKLFLDSGSSLYKISLTTAEEEPTYDFVPASGSGSVKKESSNLKILSAVTGVESAALQKIVQKAVENVLNEKGIVQK